EKDFHSFFPYDEYKNESDVKNWPIGTALHVATDTTKENGEIDFSYGHLMSGWYMIKATAKDRYGQSVTDSQYIQVFNPKGHTLPYHRALWINKDEISAHPGEKIKWQVGSSEKSFIFSKSENLNHNGELNRSRVNHHIKKVKY